MADTGRELIVDSSVLLAYFFTDEIYTDDAAKVIDAYRKEKYRLLAPDLFPYEIFNGFKSALTRKRTDRDTIRQLTALYDSLFVHLMTLDMDFVLDYAIEYDLSCYDASYIYLSDQLSKPFVTADRILYLKVKSRLEQVVWIENFQQSN